MDIVFVALFLAFWVGACFEVTFLSPFPTRVLNKNSHAHLDTCIQPSPQIVTH